VFRAPAAARTDPSAPGRPGRPGAAVKCAAKTGGDGAAIAADAETASFGPARVTAWHRMHPRLTRCGTAWPGYPPGEDLPLVEGTLVRLAPCSAREPLWLWASAPRADEAGVAALRQCYLRRFDIEHTFRFLRQRLGRARPLLRDPAAADRRTWLIIAAHDQLYLARPIAADLRLPWQRPQPPARMTPARVRAAFRAVRQTAGSPVNPPKPPRPGPGRPKGSKNKTKAPRQTVGKRNRKRPKRPKKAKRTTS
jgi:hypothetical protein